jgi:hypothetical protein
MKPVSPISSAPSAPRFVDVQVDEHDALPEGCSMRFKQIGTPRAVRRVRCEPDLREAGVWLVESPSADGTPEVAWGVTVEDSSAGTSTLVYGGAHGLRLRPDSGEDDVVAEPYLLLAPEAIVEWSDETRRD